MITRGGLYHQPKSNLSYGYNKDTLHLRFRALKGEVKEAKCIIGDPFMWEAGGAGGNLEAASASGWKSRTLVMQKEVETDYHDYFFVEIKGGSKRSRYAFELIGYDDHILLGERRIVDLGDGMNQGALSDISNFYCFPYLNGIDTLMVPDWVKDTIWYQIFPDRFRNGDKSNDPEQTENWGNEPDNYNYFGGDIAGIIEKLDYLEDLGITGIHFCPLFKGDTNHKYQTTDYKKIDPMFGTNELFSQLVEEAHSRGIKIMLDAVFNHVGINHPFFQDVLEKGQESRYFNWFNINKLPIKYGNYETFSTIGEMPRVNLECREALEYFVEVGKYWIENFNIDGWRLDVANEVTHDFWKAFRRELKALKPDLYIVGEVWHDATPWIQGDQYDAVMHYPLTDACLRYFAKENMDKEAFIHQTNHLLVHYQKNAIENSYNILDSHDTSRFIHECGNDHRKLLQAYLFLFTHPGCPSIYYGDEIGMTGQQGMGMELHRRCMIWKEDQWNQDLLDKMKDLIDFRKTNQATKLSVITWLDYDQNILAYQRGNMTVIMNRTNASICIEGPSLDLEPYGYVIYVDDKQVLGSMKVLHKAS